MNSQSTKTICVTADREEAKLAKEHELEMARVQQEAELKRIAKEHELEMAKLSQPTATGDVKVGKSNPNAFKFKPKPFNERLDTLDSWFDIYDRQSAFCGLSSETKKLHLYDCFHGKYSDSLLATDKDASYEEIKKSMLANFNLTANDYRKRFFECVPEKSETFASYLQRLEHTFNKWIALSNCPQNFDDLRNLILSHRIFDSCNQQFVTYLLERETSDLTKMETQASAYFQAHSGASLAKNSDSYLNANAAAAAFQRRPRFHNNHERGKFRDRSASLDKKKPGLRSFKFKGKDNNKNEEVKSNEVICFKCQLPGHIRPECPLSEEEAKLVRDAIQKTKNEDSENEDSPSLRTHFARPDFLSDNTLSDNQSDAKPCETKHIYSGYLKHGSAFKPVAVLRDTGSAVHAVHEKYISKDQLLPNTQKLITFGGKSETFSLAEIQVDTPFVSGTITACVLRDYPEKFRDYDILIGNGNVLGSPVARDPHPDLISSWTKDHENVLLSNQVETRSSSKGKTQRAPMQITHQHFPQVLKWLAFQMLLLASFAVLANFWIFFLLSFPVSFLMNFAFTVLKFLGQKHFGGKLKLSKKVIELKIPKTYKKFKSITSLIAFLCIFLPLVSTPFMTSKSKLVGKADPENIDWTDDLDNALLTVKKAFSAPPVLKSPNLDAIFHSGQRQRHRSRCSHASRSRQRAPTMSVCISHTDGDRDLVRASTQDTCSETVLQKTLRKKLFRQIINLRFSFKTGVPFFVWLRTELFFKWGDDTLCSQRVASAPCASRLRDQRAVCKPPT